MKKLLATVMSLFLMLGVFGISAFAADATSAKVYVTISDAKGDFVLVQEAITVTDLDEDGYLTINDALYAAHEAKYEGGAEAGYGYYTSSYGLSIGKLWGDTSGACGYYVNDVSAFSLADHINDGDYINAFIYIDQTKWSDMYTYFNTKTATCMVGDSLEVTLLSAGFDESFNPVTLPVANASITVDGVITTTKTDENGKATIKLDTAGIHTISAISLTQNIVHPALKVKVLKNDQKDNDDNDTNNDTNTNTPSDNHDHSANEKKGCQGSVSFAGAAFAIIGAAGAVILTSKRKEDR